MARKKQQLNFNSPAEEQKQGEVETITEETQEFKGAPVIHKSSIITMRNSQPTRVFFGENGKEVGSEVVGTK